MAELKRCKWCRFVIPTFEHHFSECKYCRVDGPFRPEVELQMPQEQLPFGRIIIGTRERATHE
jgi:hypothetical protein